MENLKPYNHIETKPKNFLISNLFRSIGIFLLALALMKIFRSSQYDILFATFLTVYILSIYMTSKLQTEVNVLKEKERQREIKDVQITSLEGARGKIKEPLDVGGASLSLWINQQNLVLLIIMTNVI